MTNTAATIDKTTAKPDAAPVAAEPQITEEERELVATDRLAEARAAFENGEYPYQDKLGRRTYES